MLKSPHRTVMQAFCFALLGVTLLGLLAACNTITAPQSQQTSGSARSTTQPDNLASQTTTNPALVSPTNCPATGTARALVSTPFTTANQQTLVYIVNEFKQQTPTFGTLKRYDLATGAKTEIVKIPGVTIDSAQVSADGHWLLFVSSMGALQKLQAIRIDGQGLQTLYCSAALQFTPQWSTNQQLIAFEENMGGTFSVFLLHTANGTLEKVFTQTNAGPYPYLLRSWLDTSHLYLVRATVDKSPNALALLDLAKGDNQTPADLTTIIPATQQNLSLASFDSSYDGTQLFVNYNTCGYGCTGPSDIIVEPAQGGTSHILFSNAQYAVTTTRAISAHTLLFTIENSPFGGGTVDQSHNGLWMLNTDGTGLTRLTIDNAQTITSLNASSQFPWSNVSRSNTTYAITQVSASGVQGQAPTYSILVGSLQGGSPTAIASISDGTILDIAGWAII